MEPPLTLHHGRFLEAVLRRITINGNSVGDIKPEAPFRCLGVDLTLKLDCRHQYAKAMTLITASSDWPRAWRALLRANG